MNTNCLECFCCPECDQEDSFDIAVTAWARVTDDGTEDFTNVEWSDDSVCRCVECGFTAKVKDFMVPEPENRP